MRFGGRRVAGSNNFFPHVRSSGPWSPLRELAGWFSGQGACRLAPSTYPWRWGTALNWASPPKDFLDRGGWPSSISHADPPLTSPKHNVISTVCDLLCVNITHAVTCRSQRHCPKYGKSSTSRTTEGLDMTTWVYLFLQRCGQGHGSIHNTPRHVDSFAGQPHARHSITGLFLRLFHGEGRRDAASV